VNRRTGNRDSSAPCTLRLRTVEQALAENRRLLEASEQTDQNLVKARDAAMGAARAEIESVKRAVNDMRMKRTVAEPHELAAGVLTPIDGAGDTLNRLHEMVEEEGAHLFRAVALGTPGAYGARNAAGPRKWSITDESTDDVSPGGPSTSCPKFEPWMQTCAPPRPASGHVCPPALGKSLVDVLEIAFFAQSTYTFNSIVAPGSERPFSRRARMRARRQSAGAY
jgi:hypothetical protein